MGGPIHAIKVDVNRAVSWSLPDDLACSQPDKKDYHPFPPRKKMSFIRLKVFFSQSNGFLTVLHLLRDRLNGI